MLKEQEFNIHEVLGYPEFFKQLEEAVGSFEKIYYPGCGSDKSLEAYFKKEQIVGLDAEPSRKNSDQTVRGFAETNPFRDNSFDAVFLQDFHPEEDELEDTLRVLKDGGYVIYSRIDCGGYLTDDWNALVTNPNLEFMEELPIDSVDFFVFRKMKELKPGLEKPISNRNRLRPESVARRLARTLRGI